MRRAHLRARASGEMTLWACTQLRIKLVLLHGVSCQRFHKDAVTRFSPHEIKAIRNSAGLSYHQLAAILGVKVETARGYELEGVGRERPKPVFYYVLERLKEEPSFRP
jgi:DNA-binding transcriptional regulator YiaG